MAETLLCKLGRARLRLRLRRLEADDREKRAKKFFLGELRSTYSQPATYLPTHVVMMMMIVFVKRTYSVGVFENARLIISNIPSIIMIIEGLFFGGGGVHIADSADLMDDQLFKSSLLHTPCSIRTDEGA